MCDRRGWHEAEAEVRLLGEGLTLARKCLLHMALVRDWQPTFGEILAKLTAQREAERESFTVPGVPGLKIIVDEDQEPGTMTLVGADGRRVAAFNIGAGPVP